MKLSPTSLRILKNPDSSSHCFCFPNRNFIQNQNISEYIRRNLYSMFFYKIFMLAQPIMNQRSRKKIRIVLTSYNSPEKTGNCCPVPVVIFSNANTIILPIVSLWHILNVIEKHKRLFLGFRFHVYYWTLGKTVHHFKAFLISPINSLTSGASFDKTSISSLIFSMLFFTWSDNSALLLTTLITLFSLPKSAIFLKIFIIYTP